mmetsp:Transcript_5389/g.13153  ORF Transcript_5389/g.13153 Transcript_5389/m.13153 type:complete len:270 (+) Transcript_5389:313-1122(+)
MLWRYSRLQSVRHFVIHLHEVITDRIPEVTLAIKRINCHLGTWSLESHTLWRHISGERRPYQGGAITSFIGLGFSVFDECSEHILNHLCHRQFSRCVCAVDRRDVWLENEWEITSMACIVQALGLISPELITEGSNVVEMVNISLVFGHPCSYVHEVACWAAEETICGNTNKLRTDILRVRGTIEFLHLEKIIGLEEGEEKVLLHAADRGGESLVDEILALVVNGPDQDLFILDLVLPVGIEEIHRRLGGVTSRGPGLEDLDDVCKLDL